MGGEIGDMDEGELGEEPSAIEELSFFAENLKLTMDEVDPREDLTPEEASHAIYVLNRLWEHRFYRGCLSRAAEGLIEQKAKEARFGLVASH